eukprot:TRINITY_DN51043_c0_g1_i1.p1 TRINITY_DN51043_c0_g1~~TRINITY_DN51043_c0_g1_i1.p1  ORF type:complete len:1041 (+),score=317.61 TRINITY_DN51043_c0_g1_i1:109-3231(+)
MTPPAQRGGRPASGGGRGGAGKQPGARAAPKPAQPAPKQPEPAPEQPAPDAAEEQAAAAAAHSAVAGVWDVEFDSGRRVARAWEFRPRAARDRVRYLAAKPPDVPIVVNVVWAPGGVRFTLYYRLSEYSVCVGLEPADVGAGRLRGEQTVDGKRSGFALVRSSGSESGRLAELLQNQEQELRGRDEQHRSYRSQAFGELPPVGPSSPAPPEAASPGKGGMMSKWSSRRKPPAASDAGSDFPYAKTAGLLMSYDLSAEAAGPPAAEAGGCPPLGSWSQVELGYDLSFARSQDDVQAQIQRITEDACSYVRSFAAQERPRARPGLQAYEYAGKDARGQPTPSLLDLGLALGELRVFRWLCGILDWETPLDTGMMSQCQYGCVLMAAAGFSHHPAKPEGMPAEEYEEGHAGTANSNISMGQERLPRIVHAFMNDSDFGNIHSVGHRRWCIAPGMRATGFGWWQSSAEGPMKGRTYGTMFSTGVESVDTGACFRLGAGVPSAMPLFVAYPPPGFCPLKYFGADYAWSLQLRPGHRLLLIRQNRGPVDADGMPLLPRGERGGEWRVQMYSVTIGHNESSVYRDRELEMQMQTESYVGAGITPCYIFRPKDAYICPGAQYEVVFTAKGYEPDRARLPAPEPPPAPVQGGAKSGKRGGKAKAPKPKPVPPTVPIVEESLQYYVEFYDGEYREVGAALKQVLKRDPAAEIKQQAKAARGAGCVAVGDKGLQLLGHSELPKVGTNVRLFFATPTPLQQVSCVDSLKRQAPAAAARVPVISRIPLQIRGKDAYVAAVDLVFTEPGEHDIYVTRKIEDEGRRYLHQDSLRLTCAEAAQAEKGTWAFLSVDPPPSCGAGYIVVQPLAKQTFSWRVLEPQGAVRLRPGKRFVMAVRLCRKGREFTAEEKQKVEAGEKARGECFAEIDELVAACQKEGVTLTVDEASGAVSRATCGDAAAHERAARIGKEYTDKIFAVFRRMPPEIREITAEEQALKYSLECKTGGESFELARVKEDRAVFAGSVKLGGDSLELTATKAEGPWRSPQVLLKASF